MGDENQIPKFIKQDGSTRMRVKEYRRELDRSRHRNRVFRDRDKAIVSYTAMANEKVYAVTPTPGTPYDVDKIVDIIVDIIVEDPGGD